MDVSTLYAALAVAEVAMNIQLDPELAADLIRTAEFVGVPVDWLVNNWLSHFCETAWADPDFAKGIRDQYLEDLE